MSQPELQRVPETWHSDAEARRGALEPEEHSLLLRLGSLALRARVALALGAILGAVALTTPALVKRRTYTSHASFMPQSTSSDASRLSGLAAQLGMLVPTSSNGQSPDFFAGLVRSPQLLRKVVLSQYPIPGRTDGKTASLIEILDAPGKTEAQRVESATRRLAAMTRASAVPKTGVVDLGVSASSPALTQAIAQRLLDLLNEYNLELRQSHVSADRAFTEGRLREVRGELRQHENELQSFLQTNRQLGSPQLQFERDRLQQEVELRRTLFVSLAQAYEQSRIEELRTTPTITVVEVPSAPVFPDSRRLVVKGILGMLLGSLIAFLIIYSRDSLRQLALTRANEYDEFARLRAEAMADLLHPWRPLRRMLQRRA